MSQPTAYYCDYCGRTHFKGEYWNERRPGYGRYGHEVRPSVMPWDPFKIHCTHLNRPTSMQHTLTWMIDCFSGFL